MGPTRKNSGTRPNWQKIAFGLGCAGVATAGIIWGRYALAPSATASPPADQPTPAVAPAVLVDRPMSDLARQPVAYVQGTVAITRQALGEFLIARYGQAKLENLISKRVIELACQARGIQVTEREIDAALSEDLEMLKVNRNDFVSKVLKRYGKTLYEWREDVLRPKLYMTKYCQDMVQVTPADLQEAFDKDYGPKVHCQVIVWPPEQKALALEMYEKLRKDPEEFDHLARMQANPTLAATAGLIPAFGRGAMNDPELEKEAFSLKPGEISRPIIKDKEATIVLKCAAQIPAGTDKKLEDVRAQIEKGIKDRKVQEKAQEVVAELKKMAHPKSLLKKGDHGNQGDYARQAVAYIQDNVAITREDLGEYLIARHGADRLQHLVNKRIIELACQAHGIQVTDKETDDALAEDLASLKVGKEEFEEKTLKEYGKSLYEWREDVIRPKLYMTKLCQDSVDVTPEDLKLAFEAYYGPKVHCQMILWPNDQKDIALKMYEDVRKGGADFERIAKMQANPTLAAKAGDLEPFGRHTTGNEDMEKVAFTLKPGEVSQLIPTPQGTIVLRCVEQKPGDPDKRLDDVRDQLAKEIKAKKVQAKIPQAFEELKNKAKPMVFLKNGSNDADIRKQVEEYLKVDAGKAGAPPQGN
jgi:parvulin-like peptidyl-prolyl isomerase